MKRYTQGTPTSINQLVKNAIDEFKEEPNQTEQRFRKILKEHILEFNRNVLNVIVLEHGDDLSEIGKRAIKRLTEPGR